jgi:cytochrome c biogenesis protein CcdA/thiol-disulfide isomerase/thioredoxin
MFESLVSKDNISFIMVFLEGILSFFSPCIIPLIPVYMSYLSGNTEDIGVDGKITYNRKKVFLHTICFVLGISFAFFILGMSFTAIGSFFQSNRLLFTRIAGIVIIVLGLFQIGIFNFKFLNRERKFYFNFGKRNVNSLIALIMGFTFSFAWTPCVGPMLSSVLILASSASSSLTGNLLVFVYAIGFIIPFLLLGLFTTQILNFLRNHQRLTKYTVKTGGIILILIGIMTFTGWMNSISGYLNSFDPGSNTKHRQDVQGIQDEQDEQEHQDHQDVIENDRQAYNTTDKTDSSINDDITADSINDDTAGDIHTDATDNSVTNNSNGDTAEGSANGAAGDSVDGTVGNVTNSANDNITNGFSGNTGDDSRDTPDSTNSDTDKNSKNDSNNGSNENNNDGSNDIGNDNSNDYSNKESKEEESEAIPAFDFTLVDQYGNEHTLSDYKGKVVFLNFWATWCPPCRAEMPDIEELYHEYNKNQDDVIFLGVANPRSEDNVYTNELDKEGVIDFLEQNGFTFPVVFDETGDVFMQYYISAFPTTFLIDKNGNIYGYAAGMLTKDIMKNAIEQTLNSTN